MDFFKWVEGLWNTVTSWASTGVAGAIASSAVKGAVTGIIVGGAAAVIRGDSILEGSLKGAAYGGIAGGIVGGVTSLAGTSTTQNVAKASEETIKGNLKSTPPDDGFRPMTETTPSVKPELSEMKTPPPPAPPATSTPWYKTNEGMEIIGGIGSGAAKGAGEYLAAEEKADALKEVERYRAQIDRDKISANTPGAILNAKTANITIPNWWEKHINAKTQLAEAANGQPKTA